MRHNCIVSIHQPNFFPWLGYFNKIAKSNCFIFLDNVQYERKNSGTWGNRVKFLIGGESKWITAPIQRNYKGTKKILNISFHESYPWRIKFHKSIILNYKNHLFFDKYIDFFEKLIFYESDNLSAFNINAIVELSKILKLKDIKFFKSSEFNLEKKSNELLIELVKKVDCDTYLSGGGDKDYLDESLFNKQNILVKKQNFTPLPYYQKSTEKFIPGLSIFDSIFNIGLDKTRNLIFK